MMQSARRVPLILVMAASLAVLAGLLVSSAGSATQRISAIAPAPAFSSTDLSTNPGVDWITNGGAVNNQRYSTLNQITTANAAGLTQVWHVHLNSGSRVEVLR